MSLVAKKINKKNQTQASTNPFSPSISTGCLMGILNKCGNAVERRHGMGIGDTTLQARGRPPDTYTKVVEGGVTPCTRPIEVSTLQNKAIHQMRNNKKYQRKYLVTNFIQYAMHFSI